MSDADQESVAAFHPQAVREHPSASPARSGFREGFCCMLENPHCQQTVHETPTGSLSGFSWISRARFDRFSARSLRRTHSSDRTGTAVEEIRFIATSTIRHDQQFFCRRIFFIPKCIPPSAYAVFFSTIFVVPN